MVSQHTTSITLIFCSVLLLCAIQGISNESSGTDVKDSGIFKPTKDWQTVKKGQPIPKGLHVRVNFETGITEAKLLDTDDSTTKNTAVSAISDNDDVINTGKKENIDLNDPNLRESLNKIRTKDDVPTKVPKVHLISCNI